MSVSSAKTCHIRRQVGAIGAAVKQSKTHLSSSSCPCDSVLRSRSTCKRTLIALLWIPARATVPCGESESQLPERAVLGAVGLNCSHGVLRGVTPGHWAVTPLTVANAYHATIYECIVAEHCVRDPQHAEMLSTQCTTGYR